MTVMVERAVVFGIGALRKPGSRRSENWMALDALS
jgi:hypothetical protein